MGLGPPCHWVLCVYCRMKRADSRMDGLVLPTCGCVLRRLNRSLLRGNDRFGKTHQLLEMERSIHLPLPVFVAERPFRSVMFYTCRLMIVAWVPT